MKKRGSSIELTTQYIQLLTRYIQLRTRYNELWTQYIELSTQYIELWQFNIMSWQLDKISYQQILNCQLNRSGWQLNILIIIMVSFLIAHIQCSVRFTHITPGHWTFMYSTAAISALGTNRTHCHLFHVRVKCLAQGHNIETISQYWEGRNMLFLWKSCTKRIATL